MKLTPFLKPSLIGKLSRFIRTNLVIYGILQGHLLRMAKICACLCMCPHKPRELLNFYVIAVAWTDPNAPKYQWIMMTLGTSLLPLPAWHSHLILYDQGME